MRAATVARAAERMLRATDVPGAELSVLLCDDATIRSINRAYRGLDRPTDVLAFASSEADAPAGAGVVLGDVVISVETARRQAAGRRWTIAREVRFLLAHGLLHLLGYDHRTDREERQMNALTERLCDAATSPQGVGRKPLPPVENASKAHEFARRTILRRAPRRRKMK
jgi:probable rRNA maturation factor